MDELYTGCDCQACARLRDQTDESFTFGADVVKAALIRIYQREYNTLSEIDRGLFKETYRIFNTASDKGFGVPNANDPDYGFASQIKHHNAVFSAFKVHRMQNDMSAQLLDTDGHLKPFEKWVKEVAPIADHQVRHWLQTEYSTVVIRAHRAKDWREFERNKDILPNIRWTPTTSPDQDGIHRRFWEMKLTLPVGHSFWNKHRPGDRWNCKCGWEATEEPVTPDALIPGYAPEDIPAPGLDNNPGKEGKLFSDTHPYVKHAYKDARKAVDQIVREVDATLNLFKRKTFKSGGVIETPANFKQNQQEERKNMKAYTELAKLHGEQYRLLSVTNIEGRKNPDAFNLRTGEPSDVKNPTTKNGKNAIQAAIKAASKQHVQEVYIYLEQEYDMLSIRRGLLSAFQDNRASGINHIIIRFKDGEVKRYDADEVRKFIIHRGKNK